MEFDQVLSAFSAAFYPENQKLRGNTPPEGAGKKEISLRMPRGGGAAASLFVRAPEHAVLRYDGGVSFSHLGDRLLVRAAVRFNGPAGCARLRFAARVRGDGGEEISDILEESGTAALRAWKFEQLFLTLDAPRDAVPGVYEGDVTFYGRTLFWDEQVLCQLRFTARIDSVALPAPGEGRFSLNLWQHPCNIARKHEVVPFSDAHFAILENYAKALGELGSRFTTVVCSDIPWAGQRCYQERDYPSDLFEYNYARISRDADGVFHYDFSVIGRYARLMERFHAGDRIMLTGLYGIWRDEKHGYGALAPDWPDPIRLSYTDERDGRLRFMRCAKDIEDYLRALFEYLRRENLFDKCVIMADEVDRGELAPGWQGALSRILEIAPDLRLEWDVPPRVLCSDAFRDVRVDVYTPSPAECYNAENLPFLRQALAKVEKGGLVQWSTCCWPPIPNTFLCSHLSEARAHGPIAALMGVDGFIRWNFTVWPDKPRENLEFFSPGWPAGDTCFVYPGRGGQCLLSLRFVSLRRGIEDYELLAMARDTLPDGQELCGRALQMVFPEKDLSKWNFEDYGHAEKYLSEDEEAWDAMRNMLLDALNRKEE